MLKFRTESFRGSGVRDLRQIISFEVVELGNIGTLLRAKENEYVKNDDILSSLDKLIFITTFNSYLDMFVSDLLEEISKTQNIKLNYGLWLADLDTVENIYLNDENATVDIYDIKDGFVLDRLRDGELYGFADVPKPVFSGTLDEVKNFVKR